MRETRLAIFMKKGGWIVGLLFYPALLHAQAVDSQPSPSAAPAASATATAASPKSATIVDVPAKYVGGWLIPGNVKVLFADGHSELWTKQGNCMKPLVSTNGIVGWVHFTKEDERGYFMNDTLQLRLPDGSTKDFAPNKHGPFIEQWGFAEDNTAVVIQSRGGHGPALFIKYEIASGRVTGHQDGFVPDEQMPKWAKPYAD